MLLCGVVNAQVYDGVRWIKSGHFGYTFCAVPTPDGRLVVSGGADGLKIWDVERRNLQRKIDTRSGISSIAITPDGSAFAIASGSTWVDLYEIATGRLIDSLPSDYSESVAISHDGRYLAVGEENGIVRVWDLTTRALWAEFIEHASWENVVFSPYGDTLMSAGYKDGRIRFFKISTRSVIRRIDVGYPPIIRAIAYSPTGTEAVFDGDLDAVKIIDIRNGFKVSSIDTMNGTIECITYSPDGKYIVIGCNGILDVYTTDKRHRYVARMDGPSNVNWSIRFSNDGKQLFAATGRGDIVLWNALTWTFEDFLTDFNEGVFAAAFTPDSRLAAGATWWYAFVYDAETGARKHSVHVEGAAAPYTTINAISFSPDGRYLAGGTSKGDIYIWDLDHDTIDAVLRSDSIATGRIAYSPDGSRIAEGWTTGIRIWNVKTRAIEREWHAPEAFPTSTVTYSPDGRFIATDGTGKMVRIWNVQTGQIEHAFPTNDNVVVTSFSPDGTLIGYGALDGEVVVQRIASGEIIRTFHHTRRITGVEFSPDGRMLVTGSQDSTITAWDLASGERIRSWGSYPASEVSVRLSPNGKYILLAAEDGLVCYDAGLEAAGVAGRSMSLYEATLGAGRPNPAKDITTIDFEIPGSGEGTSAFTHIALFDLFGHEVLTILDKPLDPGPHSAVIDCTPLPQGLYFVRLTTPGSTTVRELRVVR